MLEQQQIWLVNGLQELYRRAQEGEGWSGEPLKAESNGHPLTHDLLTRLGALDHGKGEIFEDNVEQMQQRLWQQNAGLMQRQESSDGSSDIAHSPPATTMSLNANTHNSHPQHRHQHMGNNHSRRHHPYPVSQYADSMARHQLPPTPPGSYSPSSSAASSQQQQQMPSLPIIKSEPLLITTSAQLSSTIPTPTSSISSASAPTFFSQQGINPISLQQHQQQPQTPWTTNSNDLSFDDLDLIGGGSGSGNQFSSLFEDMSSSSSPMFGAGGRQQQMSINCLPPSMLFEPGNDDFSQYFNTNTEISTI